VSEDPAATLVFLRAGLAEECREHAYIVIVRTREELASWLSDPKPGAEALQVEGLIGDPDAWALAAQGSKAIPLDVILEDPATEFSALYRLADVRIVRAVRVTLPVRPGFFKALRLAASLQLPVRLLPGQPEPAVLPELREAARFYLHDPMVEAPVEFFHSVFAAFRGYPQGTLWEILEQDPAVFSHRDDEGRALYPPDFVERHLSALIQDGTACATCRWQPLCAGYFKYPDPRYDCTGVKQLFAALESAADDISRDLASQEEEESPAAWSTLSTR
jgi:hypothetical protein